MKHELRCENCSKLLGRTKEKYEAVNVLLEADIEVQCLRCKKKCRYKIK